MSTVRLPVAFASALFLGLVATSVTAQVVSPWTINEAGCIPTGGFIDVTINTNSAATQQAAAEWQLTWDETIFALDPTFGMMGINFSGMWAGVANTTVPGELTVATWHVPVYPVGVDTQATVRLMHIGGFGTLPIRGTVGIWADPALGDIVSPTPFDMTTLNVQVGCGALPTCNITNPVDGQLLTGTHTMVFNATHPGGLPLNINYEYNTGAGWLPCSRVGGGPSFDLGVTPASGLTFQWDLNTDFFLPDTDVDFRITVIDTAMNGNTCEVNVDVDIVNNPPTCAFTAPMAGSLLIGTGLMTFDLTDADGNPADIVYEFDDGGGFMPASRVGGGASMDTGVMPATGLTFNWDASADVGGAATGVIFRISLDDLRPMGTSTCSITVDVRLPNNPPSCNLFFPGAGSTLSVMQTMLFSTADPDMDPVDIVFEFNAGAGYLPATAMPSSALPNPATGVPLSGANSFTWNINADVFVTTPGVIFRISIDDRFGGTNTCSKTWNIMVTLTQPTCAITAPAPGTTVGGIRTITFNAVDSGGDPLDITFEVNTGMGYFAATAGPASALPNPATGVPPAAGLTFDWDVDADVPAGMAGVMFRITVDDLRAMPSSCTVLVNVPPTSCNITSPATGSSLSGISTITFNAIDAGGDPLDITFEVDTGAGFFLATAGPGSALSNPAVGVAPASGLTFDWDFDTDVPSPQGGIVFRITVDDLSSPAGTCSITVSSCLCGDCNGSMTGPDILDSLEAAKIAAGITMPSSAQMSCCDVDSDSDLDILDSLKMAQAAAGLPVSLMCM